ncbi:exonuclease domain-containing protein [Arthrobacter sp. TmT3-37]
MAEPLFAVVDVETTGFRPGGNHRIAEIGVVRVDASGQVVDRWETLINPDRDLGPQRVHGIRAAEILDAPTFAQVAPTLTEILQGSIMVAHNIAFDAGFLAHEYKLASLHLPERFLTGLCTMQLAHDYVYGNGRSLAHCCEFLSVTDYKAHCAGDDAFAAAGLLGRYIDMDPDRVDWAMALERATTISWPASGSSAVTSFSPVLRSSTDRVEKHFLSRITAYMPEYTGPAEHDQYLDLLTQAMLDLHLSVHEERDLLALADELGISQQRCHDLHVYYLEQLVLAAWADGVITDEEQDDLYKAADILGVDASLVDRALRAAPEQATRTPRTVDPRTIKPGAVLVLTGQMARSRGELAEILTQMGYTVAENATKKTDLVIAADPDTLSGKAGKARKYGIPVVGEQFLYERIGIPQVHPADT